MNEINLFMMGLPNTGKSTFIAALWHTLQYSEISSLKLENFSGNQSYLSSIHNQWIQAESLVRTHLSSEQHRLQIDLNFDGKVSRIDFPDLSGESFQRQWFDREINPIHYKLIEDCNHLFLFIHPDELYDPDLISDLNPRFRNPTDTSTNNQTDIIDLKAPTQVQIIELLQFVKIIRKNNPLNLTIIVSAWDLVSANFPNKTPEEWCNESLPMLMHFIKTNNLIKLTHQFGVSAQGGDLSNDRDILLEYNNPADRIIVIDKNGNSINDITLPLSLAINTNE